MQKANLEYVISQATDERQRSEIGRAVRDAIEVGVVVPSILRSELLAQHLEVVEDEAALADYGFKSLGFLKRVLVRDADGELLAMGAAVDHDEALLAAVLGWFRENALPDSDVPAGIAEAPTVPTG